MSEKTKSILRPKVRFFQISNQDRDNEMVKKPFKNNTNLLITGPKIRSIVALEKPVKIVDSIESTGVYKKELSLKNLKITSDCSDDITSENIQNISPSDNNVPDTSKILHNANSRNKKKKNKVLQLDKDICAQNNTVKHCRKISQQKDKENKNALVNRIMFNKNITKTKTKNCQYIKSGMIKNEVSPVKKIVLRSTMGPKIKTFVGSGVSHKQQNDTKTDVTNKKCYNMSDVAVKKLAQPEYNSVMYTLDKLKEIKEQKIVRNINHLPPMQKNLLNGKISTALDFPLDEAIFKNLVDLSIDDKQVSTIIRSKDPEPRQKDTIPKLSDFFVPEYTTDIYTHIHVKLRVSKINEDWDTFKISNKILDWKHSLDDTR